ncbi:MAG: hypothetical protein K0R34_1982 [Herbinix sp.]|jgi:hypothetical protein|nr:hypothetical protein [Herbinix sp.]
MERIKRYFILIILVMGLFLLAGCNKFSFDLFDGSEGENGSVITLAPSEAQKDEASSNKESSPDANKTDDSEQPTDATPTPSDIQPTANVELQLYTVNVDTGEIEAVTALVPADAEITPDLIVEKVVESMVDRSIEVGIDSVTLEGDAVIVSFYKDAAPLSEMGSGYEGAILDAIAQSLIDNLEEYNKVIYRAEGEAYVSGHNELGINEVYLEEK